MEFHEKLQQLRKQKKLTQEELAEQLYVSRTAVSKWESGRGFPSIESLKAISKCFDVSLDELLSSEEMLSAAEEDHREKEKMIRDLVFGLLDCCMALLLFLPFFGQETGGFVQGVSLLGFSGGQPYLKTVYLAAVFAAALGGVLILALQKCANSRWMSGRYLLSLALSAVNVCLFTVGRQPYPAVFIFVFLLIKTFLLVKGH